MSRPFLVRSAIWLALFVLATSQGYGGVYICVSILVLIYMNTAMGGRQPGSLSAYSVFNRGHERLLGDRDPGSIDKQLRTGTLW